jgi:AcrR family transcriptional regulator
MLNKAPPTAKATTGEDKPGRKRFPHAKRREMILEAAIQYFSEVGFEGGTRELAQRAGVKQPLLYRFFPSKEELIRTVYDAVYVSRWRHDWDTLISDRSIPLRRRLIEFYDAYAKIMFQQEWIRIFLFSGLKGLDINKRYVGFMEKQVLKRICEEIRYDRGLPSIDVIPITEQELAAFWVFHGGVFYYGVRREVYEVSVHVNQEEFIELSVDGLLSGYPALTQKILARHDSPRTSVRRGTVANDADKISSRSATKGGSRRSGRAAGVRARS